MGTFLENYEIGRAVDVDAIVHCRQKLTGAGSESEEGTQSTRAQNRRRSFCSGAALVCRGQGQGQNPLDHPRIAEPRFQGGLGEFIFAVEIRIRVGFQNNDFAFGGNT
jgi:hypothetical protein